MLKLREVSDLHLEHLYDTYSSDTFLGQAKSHFEKIIPPLEGDFETVLIVAGDLATARRPNRIVNFLILATERFQKVIYVFGNHEYYGSRFLEAESIITLAVNEAASNGKLDLSKIHIAGSEPSIATVDNCFFLCGTLWTNYNNGDPVTKKCVEKYITDHKTIYDDAKTDIAVPLPVEHFAEVHRKTLESFGNWIERYFKDNNSKIVIVTHHMPSYSTVDPQFQKDEPSITLNAAFASNLDDFILKYQPKYWFFGHTHTPYNGFIGETNLICNPLGYPSESNLARSAFNREIVYTI